MSTTKHGHECCTLSGKCPGISECLESGHPGYRVLLQLDAIEASESFQAKFKLNLACLRCNIFNILFCKPKRAVY